MKQCQCGEQIPGSITIDGKTRNLRNRTKCLKCLPFGESVYSQRSVKEKRSKNTLKVQSWNAKLKEFLGEDPSVYSRKLAKKNLLNHLGGACQICGYSKCQSNLAFHHLRDKLFTLSEREFQFSMKKILPEAAKCVLVCHNCHGEIHQGLIDQSVVEIANQRVQYLLSSYLADQSNCLRCGQPCKKFFCTDCNPLKKTEWPTVEKLKQMVESSSYTKVAKELGVKPQTVKSKIDRSSV